MGQVKQLLAQAEIGQESLWGNHLRIEASEWVHVHWRDCRLVMTADQFRGFVVSMNQALDNWDGTLSEKVDCPLKDGPIPDGVIRDGALSIELQEGGQDIVHIHYNDLRIEMQLHRFLILAGAFQEAGEAIGLGEEVMIRMDQIDPYDHIHKPTREEWVEALLGEGCDLAFSEEDYWRHKDRINEFEIMIASGHQIRPIIVTALEGGRYQRRDGYCRYMAYRCLHMEFIPCFVVTEQVALAMPQHGTPAFRGGPR